MTSSAWTYPSTTLPALEAVQAAKQQSLTASEAPDLALRRAFWVDSANISLRPVILSVANATDTVDVDALADAFDYGRARRAVIDQYRIANTDAVTCSPHLFLPDAATTQTPASTSATPMTTASVSPSPARDDASVYDAILHRAARQPADTAG